MSCPPRVLLSVYTVSTLGRFREVYARSFFGMFGAQGLRPGQGFCIPELHEWLWATPTSRIGDLMGIIGFNVGRLEFSITRLWQFPGQPSESEGLEQ